MERDPLILIYDKKLKKDPFLLKNGETVFLADLKGGEIFHSGSGVVKVNEKEVSICLSRDPQICSKCKEKNLCPIKVLQ